MNGLANYTAVAKQKNSLNDDTYDVPSRQQLDLRLSLSSPNDRWLTTLYANNVTDEDEDEIVIHDVTASPVVTRFAYQQSRVIGLELTYDFR